MSVRAKFKVTAIEASQSHRSTKRPDGTYDTKVIEVRTIKMDPVYSDDPSSENRKFWEASPSGELSLGVVNPEAWEHFELGKEYYIDFTPAGS